MRKLLSGIRRLSWRQKAAIAVLLIAIVLTWVAVGVVLSSYGAW